MPIPIIWTLQNNIHPSVFDQQRPRWTGGRRVPEQPRLPWEFMQRPLLGGMNCSVVVQPPTMASMKPSQTLGFPLAVAQRIGTRVAVVFPKPPESRFRLSGVSRDSTGAVLAGCNVLVFSTFDNLLAASTVSDANGAWSVIVSRQQDYFYVKYKAGSPDVFGTSLNNRRPQ